MDMLKKVSWWLMVVGAINWGLVGAGMLAGVEGGWNVVHMLLSSMPWLEGIIYLLVGLSAIYKLCTHKSCCQPAAGAPAQM